MSANLPERAGRKSIVAFGLGGAGWIVSWRLLDVFVDVIESPMNVWEAVTWMVERPVLYWGVGLALLAVAFAGSFGRRPLTNHQVVRYQREYKMWRWVALMLGLSGLSVVLVPPGDRRLDLVPISSIGIRLSVERTQRLMIDDAYAARVVVLRGFRVENLWVTKPLELTFSAEVAFQATGSQQPPPTFVASTNCDDAEDPRLGEWMPSIGLDPSEDYLPTPMRVGPGANVEGTLCLFSPGYLPWDFGTIIRLRIEDAVSGAATMVDVFDEPRTYEASLLNPGAFAEMASVQALIFR